MENTNEDLTKLRKISSEMLLSEQFNLRRPMDNVSIEIPVEIGLATISALKRVAGNYVIAEYSADKGTRIKREVRTETWYLIVLSGEMRLEETGKPIQIYEKRGVPCVISSGSEYTLHFSQDTTMALIAIPDAVEFISLSENQKNADAQ